MKPRFSIRVFLVLCLLLGAVGVPWGWRQYQARRAAEVQRLEKELADEYAKQPFDVSSSAYGGGAYGPPPSNAPWEKWVQRVEQLEDRLEKLTGVRPVRQLKDGISRAT